MLSMPLFDSCHTGLPSIFMAKRLSQLLHMTAVILVTRSEPDDSVQPKCWGSLSATVAPTSGVQIHTALGVWKQGG